MAIGASSASAATEFGNSCLGNKSLANATILSTANAPGNPLSATAPVSGVITRWTFNVVPIPSGVLSQSLKIFHSTGSPNQFQVTGESSPAPISSGLNTFATRISVQAGDHLGTSGTASGTVITVFCETGNEGDRIGAIPGNPSVGSTGTVVEEVGKLQNPITATIEPDADNDGYGDETQDKCPQSALTQAPCPVVALSASSKATKGTVTVLITSSVQAQVTVGGTVKLGKGKSASLSGGTQVVAPGTLAQFTVLFPKALKSRLRELSPKHSLTLNLAATAPNVVGAPTVTNLSVKLKGQKKSKKHHHHHKSGRA
jgi:hypothetical protein